MRFSSTRQALQQSLLYIANHNGRHAKEGHLPKASIAARATAEPPIVARATAELPIDCKSQWQTRKGGPPPQGVNRGKSNSRASYCGKSNSGASYKLQITMAGTRTKEPPPEPDKLWAVLHEESRVGQASRFHINPIVRSSTVQTIGWSHWLWAGRLLCIASRAPIYESLSYFNPQRSYKVASLPDEWTGYMAMKHRESIKKITYVEFPYKADVTNTHKQARPQRKNI